MAVKKKSNRRRLTGQVLVRLNATDQAALDRLANSQGLSAAGYLRSLLASELVVADLPRSRPTRRSKISVEAKLAIGQLGRSVGLLKVAAAMRAQQRLDAVELDALAAEASLILAELKSSISWVAERDH